LSIALAEATPGPGRPGPPLPARWLVLGEGAREGALAALAEAEGFTGDTGLIDGPWLKGAHGLEANAAAMTDGLGKESVLTSLSIKPFCSAKQAVAAVAALRAILGRGVAPDSIRSVKVLVPEAYRVMIGHPASAGNRSSSILSVAYQLAIAAHDPDQLYDVARERIAASGPVVEFAKKVTVAADDKLAAHYPARWPARIEVETASGTASEEVVDAPGDPGRPLDLAAVRDKFHRCIDPLLGPGEVDGWIAAAEGAVADDGALAELGRRLAAHEAKVVATA
jgi:2-methylcitrate dehydratase PrpD